VPKIRKRVETREEEMNGDLTINTPQALVQCQNVTITWNGGVGMFPSLLLA